MKNLYSINYKVLFSMLVFACIGIKAQTVTICMEDSSLLILGGYNGTIQWQKSADVNTWNDVSGGINDSLMVKNQTTTFYYRAKVSTSCASYFSDTTLININTSCNADSLIINEIDYDNVSAGDANEFVEIYNASSSQINLTGITLVFVNGSSNNEYLRVDLGQAGTLAAHSYLVVGSGTLAVPTGIQKINFAAASNSVQNGAPDGVLLLNTINNKVYDALSYEGAMNAATVIGITGTVDLVENAALSVGTADSNTINGSLSRLPSGTDTDNSANDWNFTTTPTPGAVNIP